MKLLYSQSTQQTFAYPRSDDQPVVGLDPDFLVLIQVDTTPPERTENQLLSSTYVVDIPNMEYRQQWVLVDNPPTPDWDNFNLTFSTLPSLIQAEITANQNHPSITGKKDDAYTMIDSHGVAAFGYIFPLFCQAGNVTQETRNEWATLAESFNMPADFVAIIRGTV